MIFIKLVYEQFPLFLTLFALGLSGFPISKFIFGKQNKPLSIGLTLTLGIVIYLFILMFLSNFFTGTVFIKIFTLLFVGFGFSQLVMRFKKLIQFFEKNRFRKNDIVFLVIPFFYIFLIFARLAVAPIGADAQIYFGIASSFGGGNYPISLPWQPEFLSVYHVGTYVLEGALQTFSGVNIYSTHILLSFYMLIALLFLLVGISNQYYKGFSSYIPFVWATVVFAWPILLKNGYFQFIGRTLLILKDLSLSSLFKYPQLFDFKASIGAGAMNLDGLIYVNFSLFGLLLFILFIFSFFFFIKVSRREFSLLIFLSAVSALTLSVDETFFLLELPFIAILVIWLIIKGRFSYVFTKVLLFGLILVSSFVALENPILDSYLTPAQQSSRFKIVVPEKFRVLKWLELGENEQHLTLAPRDVWNYTKAKTLNIDGTTWYLPDIKVVIGAVLVFSLLVKSRWSFILSVASALSIVYGLVFVNTFWSANNLRFVTKAWQLISLASGILILTLLGRSKYQKIIGVFLLVISLPQLIVAHAKLTERLGQATYSNYIDSKQMMDADLEKVENAVSKGERVLFIDGYPFSQFTNFTTTYAVTRYQITSPVAPYFAKILMPDDAGVDWHDAVTTLDPKALKNLKIDYVYLAKGEEFRFSEEVRKLLKEEKYFKSVFNNDMAEFYSVSPDYFDLEVSAVTLRELLAMIPNSESVYSGELLRGLPRKIIVGELAGRTKLYGYPLIGGYDSYMYIEKFITLSQVCDNCKIKTLDEVPDINFLVVDPKTDISVLTQRRFIKVYEIPFVALWRAV